LDVDRPAAERLVLPAVVEVQVGVDCQRDFGDVHPEPRQDTLQSQRLWLIPAVDIRVAVADARIDQHRSRLMANEEASHDAFLSRQRMKLGKDDCGEMQRDYVVDSHGNCP
jgi:hypothetical protein